jgi:hypothetical protein
MLGPHPPGLLRDVVINFAAKVVIERRLVQTWQFPFQFHAIHEMRHTLPSIRSCDYRLIIKEDGEGNTIPQKAGMDFDLTVSQLPLRRP